MGRLRLDETIDYSLSHHQASRHPDFPFGGIIKVTSQGKPKLTFYGLLDFRYELCGRFLRLR
jgi:hypothetical protein